MEPNEVTPEDRAALVEQAAHYKREAARLTAENERLRADDRDETNRANRFEALFHEQKLEREAAESRLAEANAENERLRAELDSAEQRASDARAGELHYARRAEAADALTAELSRLRADASEADKASLYSAQREQAAESRLATAVGLLRRGPGFMTGGASWPAWCDEVRAFLASAQPAAPYGTADESPGFNAAWKLGAPKPAAPARAEAEQAVLDAMADVPEETLRVRLDFRRLTLEDRAVYAAELARREAAK